MAYQFETITNFRSLAGINGAEGSKVRSNILFRAAHVSDISQADTDQLQSLKIKQIIDFRSVSELEHRPAPNLTARNIDQIALPIGGNAAAWVRELFESLATSNFPAKELHDQFIVAFQTIPIENVDKLGAFFNALLTAPDNAATLFHCTAGKDRTGITAALTLSILGAHKDDIYADFLRTNEMVNLPEAMAKTAARISNRVGVTIKAEDVMPLVSVDTSFLDAAFASITDTFGTLDHYIENGLKMTKQDIDQLRCKYLE